MHVVHVGNYKPDSSNGVDKTIVGLVRHLSAHGIEIEVWHPTHRIREIRTRIEDGVTIYDLPVYKIFKGFCIFSPKARRFIAGKIANVELFHFHSVFQRENLRLANLGVPYVVTPNGGYDSLVISGRNRLGKAIWFKLWEQSFLQKARMIHAVSVPEQQEIINLRLDVPVKYIPNGVDNAALCRDIEAPSRYSDFVYLGRLAVLQKGLDFLIQGYAKARAKVPDLPRLVLAGPDFRGGLGQLTDLARRLSIADKVVFRSAVFGDQKWQLLSQARLFVHTSRWEGMPFALLEAMSVGRPVFVTPGSNMAEYVRKAGAGIVVDCDVDSIAEGLERAAGLTEENLDIMGRCSRSMMVAKFSWQTIAGELSREYRIAVAH